MLDDNETKTFLINLMGSFGGQRSEYLPLSV